MRIHPLSLSRRLVVVALIVGPACASDDGGAPGQTGLAGTGNATTSPGGSSTTSDPDAGPASTGLADQSTTADPTTGDTSDDTGADDGALIDARPYDLVVPTGYDPEVPTPVVILLHGYGANASLQDGYFRFSADAEEHGYLLALPEGLTDGGDSQFWNATDACCNFGGDPVDDVAYLGALIDDVQAQYNVDAKRVFVVGHSNGGFMAHRLACDIGDRVAAIVSLAGATWNETTDCAATQPVNILQVHGTADETILFGGGNNAGLVYPSANETVAQWAASNGCRGELAPDGSTDLETSLDGEETLLSRFADCPEGGQVALWTIEEGGHIPAFDDGWADAVWTYLEAHPKP